MTGFLCADARGLLAAPDILRARVGRDRVTLRTADDSAAVAALHDRFGIDAVVEDGALRFGVADGESFAPRLVTGLGVPVLAVRTDRPTLDDVFLTYTGRSMRDGQAGAAEQMRTFARMRR